MKIEYLHGDEGRAYYTKGHVAVPDFMAALGKEVDADDPILLEQPEHTWLRFGRDFQEGHPIVTEAKPESRGAFRATYIQDA